MARAGRASIRLEARLAIRQLGGGLPCQHCRANPSQTAQQRCRTGSEAYLRYALVVENISSIFDLVNQSNVGLRGAVARKTTVQAGDDPSPRSSAIAATIDRVRSLRRIQLGAWVEADAYGSSQPEGRQVDHAVIAGRIKSARRALGISQGALANKLGVHRATIAHWEREGGFVPSVDNLRALSQELQVGFEWLAVGEVSPRLAVQTVVPDSRRRLESRMLQLSRHVPVSFLATVIALLESASAYLE
ncbi:helix-turn-helix domain-containing protein [Xanthomonas prunicola]|uniref:helix-turn-helix transcriptional regulator n=1 Tax=Xanthomonas prunicola TaxID=2053930 RepID=UPI0021B3F219|nr:helix-turn-helix transcriptional regulator [Xanthomonas prunicola]UXA54444.1 helix-turn-helix domain-containing protein [Xanthomonas prunicola]UXA67923.1 helix-turn-helix domain-containing protein [Xanthomonas prunicola]